MVARWLWLLVALWLVPLTGARAQATSAVLRPDTDTVKVGQTIGLTLVISGGEPAGIPDIPGGRHLQVTYRTMSTTVSYINGIGSRVVQLGYELTALAEGTAQVGPVGVRLRSGRTVTAPALAIVVSEPDPAQAMADPLEVSAGFGTDVAWVGQTVVWTESLRTRVPVASQRWHGRPTDGFLPPADSRPEETQWVVDGPDGAVRHVTRSWPLLTTEPGERVVSGVAVDLELVEEGQGGRGLLGFFRRTRRDVRRVAPVSLTVRPLPPAPAGFSGLVGQFELTSRVEQQTARVGESITWQLALRGDGSLEGVRLPPLHDLPNARVYDGTPRVNGAMRDGRWWATATVSREVVPTRMGTLELPPVELVVFDPEVGDYRTLTAPGATVEVAAGEDGKAEIRSFAEDPGDVMVAESEPDPLFAPRAGPGLRLPVTPVLPILWGLAALPGLAIGLLSLGDLVRRWHQARAAQQADRPRTLAERLADLPDDPDARLAALEALLRERVEPGDPLLAELVRVRFAGVPSARDLDARVIARLRQGDVDDR